MPRTFARLLPALTLLMSVMATTAALARPPTAQVSPGYEARLAEARKAAQLAAQQRMIVPRPKRHHHRSAD